MSRLLRAVASTAIALAIAVFATTASATVPGRAGAIAFEGWNNTPQAVLSGSPDEVYVRDTDGTVRQLTNNAVYDGDPRWSPSGRLIAFDSARGAGGAVHIWMMDSTGAHAHRVSHGPGDDYYPSWSPDGRWIAYESDQMGRSAVYVVHPDGTGQHRVTPLDRDSHYPSWSPDGQWIAFSSNRTGHGEVYKVRPDGSDITQLTHQTGDVYGVAWSPNGRLIAFDEYHSDKTVPPLACTPTCGLDGHGAIWTVSATGHGLRQLVSGPAGAFDPAWAPDSQSLLYSMCPPPFLDCDIWQVGVDGSGAHDVSLDPQRGAYYPDWQALGGAK